MTTQPATVTSAGQLSARWVAVRRYAGYGAALAITPYLVIKVLWVVGALIGVVSPTDGLSVFGWVLLNTATIGLALAAIVLMLAVARARRLPAVLLLGLGWIAAGLLVPMIPFMLVSAAIGGDSGDPAGQRAGGPPSVETALIGLSFLGLALGLAVALPIHLRERWPAGFVGRLRDGHRGTVGYGPALLATAAGAPVGAVQLYWAFGGTLGLVEPALRVVQWRLLVGNTGLWTVLGVAGGWLLVLRRPARLPRWQPVVAVWAGSGLLFAWSAWKLPFTWYLAYGSGSAARWPEDLAVVAVTYTVSLVAGVAMLATLVSAVRAAPGSRAGDSYPGSAAPAANLDRPAR